MRILYSQRSEDCSVPVCPKEAPHSSHSLLIDQAYTKALNIHSGLSQNILAVVARIHQRLKLQVIDFLHADYRADFQGQSSNLSPFKCGIARGVVSVYNS